MSSSYQINVKTLTGKTELIEVNASMKISELKQKINGLNQIPVEQQRLIFNGKELTENSETLSERNIMSGSTIHLILSLRG